MRRLLIAFTLFFLLGSCATGVSTSIDHNYDTLYAPRYASHFVVLESEDSIFLRVRNPWQGAKGVEYSYGFVGDKPERIIAMSSSHTAFFDALGLTDQIVGVSSPQYLCNTKLQNLPDVGYDNNLHYETIVGLKPDVLTTYEISGENSSSRQKLQSLGIPLVYVADYLEDSPLGKAEWLVAFGAMSGRVDQAMEIFESVESNYIEVKSTLEKYRSESGVEKKPKIMLNSPYKDVWYLPGDSSYFVQLMVDAGGDYVGKGVSDNVSRTVSVEVAYSMLQEADLWLNPAANILFKSDLKGVNALLQDIDLPLYNNTKRGGKDGGSDFWESGVLRPDIALRDLVKILYPELLPNHTLYYYKEIE